MGLIDTLVANVSVACEVFVCQFSYCVCTFVFVPMYTYTDCVSLCVRMNAMCL